jgi:hypothetical protein
LAYVLIVFVITPSRLFPPLRKPTVRQETPLAFLASLQRMVLAVNPVGFVQMSAAFLRENEVFVAFGKTREAN